MSRRKLTALALDAFRELGNIGSAHASAALATMLNRKVDITVPRISFLRVDGLAEYADPAETVVAAHLGVEGDVNGIITFCVPENRARELAQMITGMEIGLDSELGVSMIKELANIVSGAFLNALNGMTNLNSFVQPPQFYAGAFRGAFNDIVSQLSQWGEQTFICETAFVHDNSAIQSYLLFLPSPQQLEMILMRMGLPEVFEQETI